MPRARRRAHHFLSLPSVCSMPALGQQVAYISSDYDPESIMLVCIPKGAYDRTLYHSRIASMQPEETRAKTGLRSTSQTTLEFPFS